MSEKKIPYEVRADRISRTQETAELYKAEAVVADAQQKAIEELCKVLGVEGKNGEGYNTVEFYHIGLPSHLYTVLDGWDRLAVMKAIEAYLEMNLAKVDGVILFRLQKILKAEQERREATAE